MRATHSIVLLAAIAMFGSLQLTAQDGGTTGSLEVSGRIKIDGKQEKFSRKRFYLIRGGVAENKSLLDRLTTASVEPRDCYYARMNASPEFICWLRTENCDSPYCRKITDRDVERVPEFRAARDKGTRAFRNRGTLAIDWLTTNLPTYLANGFYDQRRHLTETLLGDVKPLMSAMTDSVTVKATFVDIPVLIGPTETFLVTNILPIEFGGKSYLWACEVGISSTKPTTMRLLVPEGGKPVKNCEVWVKELPACKTEPCGKT